MKKHGWVAPIASLGAGGRTKQAPRCTLRLRKHGYMLHGLRVGRTQRTPSALRSRSERRRRCARSGAAHERASALGQVQLPAGRVQVQFPCPGRLRLVAHGTAPLEHPLLETQSFYDSVLSQVRDGARGGADNGAEKRERATGRASARIRGRKGAGQRTSAFTICEPAAGEQYGGEALLGYWSLLLYSAIIREKFCWLWKSTVVSLRVSWNHLKKRRYSVSGIARSSFVDRLCSGDGLP